jgi:hypothetical protein
VCRLQKMWSFSADDSQDASLILESQSVSDAIDALANSPSPNAGDTLQRLLHSTEAPLATNSFAASPEHMRPETASAAGTTRSDQAPNHLPGVDPLLEQQTLEDADAVAQSSVISLRARIERYEQDVEIQRKPYGSRLHSKGDEFLRMFVRVAKFNTERALLRLALQQEWLDMNVRDKQRLAATEFRRALEARAVQPLPGVDAHGRACLLVSVRCIADTHLLSSSSAVARFAFYVAARWLRERGDVVC